MSKQEVIAVAGKPYLTNKVDENAETFDYGFLPPKQLKPKQTYLAGFMVVFENGVVDQIRPVYGELQ